MSTATITNDQNAAITYETLTDANVGRNDALRAMGQAERFGTGLAQSGVLVIHAGYVRNAVEFNAGTATYRVSIDR